MAKILSSSAPGTHFSSIIISNHGKFQVLPQVGKGHTLVSSSVLSPSIHIRHDHQRGNYVISSGLTNI